jgi:hypothetical protein
MFGLLVPSQSLKRAAAAFVCFQAMERKPDDNRGAKDLSLPYFLKNIARSLMGTSKNTLASHEQIGFGDPAR